jgi:hypothetical protein
MYPLEFLSRKLKLISHFSSLLPLLIRSINPINYSNVAYYKLLINLNILHDITLPYYHQRKYQINQITYSSFKSIKLPIIKNNQIQLPNKINQSIELPNKMNNKMKLPDYPIPNKPIDFLNCSKYNNLFYAYSLYLSFILSISKIINKYTLLAKSYPRILTTLH